MLLFFIHINEKWKQNRHGIHRGTETSIPAARHPSAAGRAGPGAAGQAHGARRAEAGHTVSCALGCALRLLRQAPRGGGAANETRRNFVTMLRWP